ncbi:hypothetical protein H5410_056594 [Solanum commersonii]|uniref:Uncharacterized protein n=1 Tax=Solanum commersonii TaxID=4109 RepID=A0A9J5WMQ1_SOLCO|nr:hypothetical protein H5410_056594 [Solanum commersonii]
MELIGPDGLTGPFSWSNDPRSGLSYEVGWSRWANRPIFKGKQTPQQTGKPAHFQGQMIIGVGKPPFCRFLCASPWIFWSSRFSTSFLPNFLMKIRQDRSYGSGWSRHANRPIVKSVDLLVIRISNVIFVKPFCGHPSRPSVWSWLIKTGKQAHIQDFRRHYGQIFSWTSFKNLSMEPVRPDEKTAPFSRSNEPRSNPWIFGSSGFQTPFFLKFFMDVRQEIYLCSQLVLTGKPAHCQGKRIHGVDLAIELVASDGETNPFSRFLTLFLLNLFADVRQYLRYGAGRSRWENWPIFKVRGSLKQIFSWMFVDNLSMELIFDVIFLKIFYGRSSRPLLWSRLVLIGKSVQFKTLTMEPVGPDWETSPFSRSNDPWSGFLWTSIKTLTMDLDGPDGKTVSFSRFPMSFLSKFFVDGRPLLWSQLVPMGKPAHFQGQTNPVSDNHLILPIFVCIVHGSSGDPDFHCHFCQNFSRDPLRP